MVAGCRFDFSHSACSRFSIENSQRADATGRPGNHYCVVDQLSFCLTAVPAIEPFDAARSVDQLLLACEERMAIGTDLKPDLRLRRPCLPRLTAGAMHGRVHVFWVNISLHFLGYSCCEFFGRSNVRG